MDKFVSLEVHTLSLIVVNVDNSSNWEHTNKYTLMGCE